MQHNENRNAPIREAKSNPQIRHVVRFPITVQAVVSNFASIE
jgi:hypothetical protein